MDVVRALSELIELSSQVERAVVLDAEGAVVGSTPDDEVGQALAQSARDLAAAAADLRSAGNEVTRVEVELAEGAIFVLREGRKTIAATTGPGPTAGLVAYDLRTCLQAIDEPPKPKRRRAVRKPKESE